MQVTWVLSLGWQGPLEKGRLPALVFWPGEFPGMYSPWGRKVRLSHYHFRFLKWFILRLTGLISLQSQGLSRVFSNTTVKSINH